MDHRTALDRLLAGPGPILALAPMQHVTDLPFWRLVAAYGGADVYFTEYFRVYPSSRLSSTFWNPLPRTRPAGQSSRK